MQTLDYCHELFGLRGKVAVVTGGARGLGWSIATGLLKAGAAVLIADADELALADAIESMRQEGWPLTGIRADVTVPEEVEQIFAMAVSTYGHVDILVNNAGIGGHRDRPEHYPLDEWQRLLAINLTGYYLCACAAGRRMIDQGHGGNIVNVSSISATSSLGRGSFAYAVSKSGVNQLTRELAVEWARHGIRVNAIQPCQFVTRGWSARIADSAQADMVRRVKAGIPLGRMGVPDDIIGPVVFLVSAAASMITGAILPVDGGNLAMNPGALLDY